MASAREIVGGICGTLWFLFFGSMLLAVFLPSKDHPYPYVGSIVLQCIFIGLSYFAYFYHSKKQEIIGKSVPKKSTLSYYDPSAAPPKSEQPVVSNRAYHPSCQQCGYCKETTHGAVVEYEDFWGPAGAEIRDYGSTYNCRKFDFDLDCPDFRAEKCTSFISENAYKNKCLNGEINNQNARVQVNMDFSSLKDVMVRGGLVMTTYNCPNCGGMINIPETGQVLVCKYCGIQIKPVDIFEKIKSLIR